MRWSDHRRMPDCMTCQTTYRSKGCLPPTTSGDDDGAPGLTRHVSAAEAVSLRHTTAGLTGARARRRTFALLQLVVAELSNRSSSAPRPPRPPRPGRPARSTVYARLDASIAGLRAQLGGLPTPAKAESIWDEIWVHEAHNSTAIEGNTLVLRQVEELLREGRAVGSKQLAEYLEVQGYAEAARWVYGQA